MILIKTNVGHILNILKHSDIVQSSINLNGYWWLIAHDNEYHVLKPRRQPQSSSVWRQRMTFINRHHVFHMQFSTQCKEKKDIQNPHHVVFVLGMLLWFHIKRACFFSASRHYSNNVLIMIYIWGTVMVYITKQNWQNIPIVLQKGRLSPRLTLRVTLKRLWCRACKKKKAFLFWVYIGVGIQPFPTPFCGYLSPLTVGPRPTGSEV